MTSSKQFKNTMTPLSFDALDHVSTFASEQCPDGLVAIAANTLRILTVTNNFSYINYSH